MFFIPTEDIQVVKIPGIAPTEGEVDGIKGVWIAHQMSRFLKWCEAHNITDVQYQDRQDDLVVVSFYNTAERVVYKYDFNKVYKVHWTQANYCPTALESFRKLAEGLEKDIVITNHLYCLNHNRNEDRFVISLMSHAPTQEVKSFEDILYETPFDLNTEVTLFDMNPRSFSNGALLEVHDEDRQNYLFSPERKVYGYIKDDMNAYIGFHIEGVCDDYKDEVWNYVAEELQAHFLSEEKNPTAGLIETILTGREKTIKRLKNQKKRAEEKINHTLARLPNINNQVRNIEKQIQMFSQPDERLQKHIENELNEMSRLDKVVDIQVYNNKIYVYTSTLYCEHENNGNIHEIGDFRIVINLSPECDDVLKWFNLTRVIVGYNEEIQHAPHVFSGGKACLGSMADLIPELVQNHELATLTDIAIQFIEQANIDDDAGCFLDEFPIVKEKQHA